MPDGSRRSWQLIAALVLLLDGLAALAFAAVSLAFTMAPAAVEGRTGNPNAHLAWYALGLAAFGVAALIASWRIARGRRGARLPGAAAALVVAGLSAWVATASSLEPAGWAAMGGIIASNLLTVLALGRWREPAS